MNCIIPINYNLNIYDLFNDSNIIECTSIYKSKIYTFSNFSLYTNRKNIIYQISSNVCLEYLLDILHTKENLIIKKIYYFLIIKNLIKKKNNIKTESLFAICYCGYTEYYDVYLKTRDYHISNNNEIIITEYIDYNICLILINRTLNKSFICIIDRNCLISNLCEIIENSRLYNNSRYENIDIILIGCNIDNVDILIHIYIVLKELKLSKYITKTYLFYNKSLKSIKFNTFNSTIEKIRYYSNIKLPPKRDITNYQSYLNHNR